MTITVSLYCGITLATLSEEPHILTCSEREIRDQPWDDRHLSIVQQTADVQHSGGQNSQIIVKVFWFLTLTHIIPYYSGSQFELSCKKRGWHYSERYTFYQPWDHCCHVWDTWRTKILFKNSLPWAVMTRFSMCPNVCRYSVTNSDSLDLGIEKSPFPSLDRVKQSNSVSSMTYHIFCC